MDINLYLQIGLKHYLNNPMIIQALNQQQELYLEKDGKVNNSLTVLLDSFLKLELSMSELHKAINKTIEIGKKFSNLIAHDIEKDHSKLDINFNQEMHYKIFSNFSNIYLNYMYEGRDEEYEDIQLTTEELMFLFKGAVIGEVYLRKGFCHGFGSVSTAIVVLHKLITVDLEKAKEVYEWARNFGFCNTYIPDPNDPHNIMHFSHKEDEVEQATEIVKKLIEEKMLKQEEEQERQERYARRREISKTLKVNDMKDRSLGLREILIEELASMSNEERLIKLAEDDRHSPKYYPLNMFYDITCKEIQNLKPEYRSKLSKRFDIPLKKSPWKKFKAWHSL